MSSILLCTRVEALGDVNKVATLPPRGVGLRVEFYSLLRLRPRVMRIRLSLHHLGEVVCGLNLNLYPG